MFDKRIMTGIIVAAVLVAIGYAIGQIPSGIEIENIEPKEYKIKKFEESEITFDLKNYGSEDVANAEIHTFSEYATPKFLRLQNTTIDKIIGSEEGLKKFSMVPAIAYETQGSEITYVVELKPYVNGQYVGSETIQVKVIPSFSSALPFDKNNENGQLGFADLNSKRIEINSGDEKDIEFRVKSNEDGLAKDLKVEAYIDNNNSNFINIERYEINETLDNKDEQTGKQRISITSSGSEGNEIKYEVYLRLFANGIQMDVEKIDVILKPPVR